MLDFIFPYNVKCIVCSKEIYDGLYHGMCSKCYESIVFTSDYHSCKLCGRPICRSSAYKKCSECQKHNRNFTGGYSCTVYEDVSQRLMMNFKYNDKSFLYKFISDLMIDKIREEKIEFDYIVYTPSHISRKLVRGFNQTELIAKYIGQGLGAEVLDNLIIRKKITRRLKKLSRLSREKELRDAFKFNKNFHVYEKSLLLIDDIFTTGSTLDACSKLLLENGASNVNIITFAVKCNYDYNVYK